MTTVASVEKTFVEFYRAQGYLPLESGSLLSSRLPMTFVMSAGMVQFEELAEGRRSGDHFVLVQNCFRHFDLNRVGGSLFHLSLFQMPGAFDFGPIDRRATVRRIWDLVVNRLGVDPARLTATYFQGGRIGRAAFPADQEVARAWAEVGLPAERIQGLDAVSNFWKQSERMVGVFISRKCGPNTELFYDRGIEYSCGPGCRVGCACGRFLEFMNTLFISHTFDETGRLAELPEPFVETVIGLERVAAIGAGVGSVYEVDTLAPLVQQVRCFSRPEILGAGEQRHYEHILVDHLRALLFLARDGAPAPGKGGRAHLIRILLRELLTSQRLLGITDPGFFRSMLYCCNDIYPDLCVAHPTLRAWMLSEERSFSRTLRVELRRFEDTVRAKNRPLHGEEILLYEKEHGIPFALIAHMLSQMHVQFDRSGYQAAVLRSSSVLSS